jgi:hypothetical protein
MARLPVLKVALLIVMIAPGIYACARLYPYEYIYYNSLTGGVSGAYRKFELDYWATSFRESVTYIDQNAEPKTRIAALGGKQVARDYARDDLPLTNTDRVAFPQAQSYYILASTRANLDLTLCQNINTVFSVQRAGALLSYVKEVGLNQTCQ